LEFREPERLAASFKQIQAESRKVKAESNTLKGFSLQHLIFNIQYSVLTFINPINYITLSTSFFISQTFFLPVNLSTC